VDGWRGKFAAYGEGANKKFGVVKDKVLVLSDGREIALEDCDVTFQD
jgi:hypothetical protein